MKPKRISITLALLAGAAALALALTGCSSQKAKTMEHQAETKAGVFTLTFAGNSTFHGPHGGQAIHVALVDSETGMVVAKQSGTVSRTANPAFSFTFKHAMVPGRSYEVDYWIDSNFGGGTVGKCDPPQHDHQWDIHLGKATGNIDHVETHEPAKITPVCDVFGGQ